MRTGNLSTDLDSAENVDISKLDIDSKLSHAELDLHRPPTLEGSRRLYRRRVRLRGGGATAGHRNPASQDRGGMPQRWGPVRLAWASVYA
jgi:hypothetical protein